MSSLPPAPDLHLHTVPPPEDIAAARALPHAQGPEKSILSSMLKEPERWLGIAIEEGITRDHFYFPGHATLFEVLRELSSAGKPIELVSLVALLHDRGLLDGIGGPAAVTDIFSYAPNSAHFAYHLGLVRDKFILRRLIHITIDSAGEAYANPEDPLPLLDRVESAILSIRTGNEPAQTFNPKAAVKEVITHFEQLLSGETDPHGAPTGFADLDRMTRGLKPGEMFVIAARPSMGKTSLMMNIAEHLCVDRQVPTLVFSCEMTAFQLMQRLVYSRAKFPMAKLASGLKPNRDELQRLKRASEQIATAPIFIDDTSSISIDTLRAKARRRKRENGIGFIAIDYLQLLKSGSRQAQNSREREIGEISAGIKALAKELGIPILVLAQLNRGPEGRSGKNLGVPRMSDLRESGTIEQDADMIGLLYRTAYYAESEEEKEQEAGKAELVLAKNRNGETGHVHLTFLADLMRFESRSEST